MDSGAGSQEICLSKGWSPWDSALPIPAVLSTLRMHRDFAPCSPLPHRLPSENFLWVPMQPGPALPLTANTAERSGNGHGLRDPAAWLSHFTSV